MYMADKREIAGWRKPCWRQLTAGRQMPARWNLHTATAGHRQNEEIDGQAGHDAIEWTKVLFLSQVSQVVV